MYKKHANKFKHINIRILTDRLVSRYCDKILCIYTFYENHVHYNLRLFKATSITPFSNRVFIADCSSRHAQNGKEPNVISIIEHERYSSSLAMTAKSVFAEMPLRR